MPQVRVRMGATGSATKEMPGLPVLTNPEPRALARWIYNGEKLSVYDQSPRVKSSFLWLLAYYIDYTIKEVFAVVCTAVVVHCYHTKNNDMII